MARKPTPATNTETEMKLGVWPGFTLPPLDDVAPWLTADAPYELVLDAVYHDTIDLRLTRAGITVRHRTGDGPPEGRWTAKIPHPPVAGELIRTELDVDGPGDTVPEPILSVLRGLLRGASIVPEAHLRTSRQVVVLRDGGGRPAAEVADDEVSVLEGDRVAARFREVEVEVAPGAPSALLVMVANALRASGAGDPEQIPKLVRALGPRAQAPPDPVVPALGDRPTAAAAVQAALASSVRRLLTHDPAVRLDIGSFAVHQARVSTRRLRSDLRSYERLLDPRWAADLSDQISWLTEEFGNVRDLDVLGMRLRRDAANLDKADADQAMRLLRRLDRQRSGRLKQLHEAMDGTRYLALLDRLVDAACVPRFSHLAKEPATEVLADLARGPWRQLVKAASKLDESASDDQLHKLRIKAKRARYAAEAASVAIPEAAAHAEVIAELQGVLGELHDAVVAEQWLRTEIAAGASRQQAMAAGLLVMMQRDEAARRRGEWAAVWRRCSRKKVTAWLG